MRLREGVLLKKRGHIRATFVNSPLRQRAGGITAMPEMVYALSNMPNTCEEAERG